MIKVIIKKAVETSQAGMSQLPFCIRLIVFIK